MRSFAAVLALLLPLAAGGDGDGGLVVHEWGTFTAVAGEDGAALEWRPLSGPSDLPAFVYGLGKDTGLRYDRTCPKCSRHDCYCRDCKDDRSCECGSCVKAEKATVRMETPVIYFYADREMSVSAKVEFPKGKVTEWYPQAMSAGHGIDWGRFLVQPKASPPLPKDDAGGRYAAARGTDASPVRVCGSGGRIEYEKFLFYRGVGTFGLPLAASLPDKGEDEVLLRNLGPDPLGRVILFERQGKQASCAMADLPGGGEVRLGRPVASEHKGELSCEAFLKEILLSKGLYPKEAAAMIEAWKDSWFEEGLRVFYVLPEKAVDGILPLSIDPKPREQVRVLVGRLEIVTPEQEKGFLADVERLGDPSFEVREKASEALRRRGRFAEPALRRILPGVKDPEVRARIEAQLAGGK